MLPKEANIQAKDYIDHQLNCTNCSRDAAMTRQRFSLFSWCSHGVLILPTGSQLNSFDYIFLKIIKNTSGIQTIHHFLYCSWYFVFLNISFQPKCNSKTHGTVSWKLVHSVQALERGDMFLLENKFTVAHTHLIHFPWLSLCSVICNRNGSVRLRALPLSLCFCAKWLDLDLIICI